MALAWTAYYPPASKAGEMQSMYDNTRGVREEEEDEEQEQGEKEEEGRPY